jgi:transcriptional regulator with XRE-family HTH domain
MKNELKTNGHLPQSEDFEEDLSPAESSKINSYILTKLKERLNLKTDSELAEKLGCHTSYITLIRTGRRHFPLHVKLRMLDKLGYLAVRDLLMVLTPSGLARTISLQDNERMNLDIGYKDDPLPGNFSEIVAEAIRKHGPEPVAAAVKVELMKFAAAKGQSSSVV